MLFVNEELEESQPVFSEPRKVQPKTDDEMVRRIKSMLGEYVHENEFSVDESMELEGKDNMIASSHSTEVDSNTKSPHQKSCEEKQPEDNAVVFNSMSASSGNQNVEKKIDDQNDSLNSNENTSQLIENCQNSSEASSISSRRCSLKRQCKERISLLDYNPMFTIRTKRTKVNPSNKEKSSENSDIPTLKKCPEMQLPDNLSEITNQDPPPLLDAMQTPSYNYSSPYGKDNMNDVSVNDESSKYNFKNKDDSSFLLETISHQAQMKLKKQTKKRKKKKILYESLPVPEVLTLSASAQDPNSVDAKIGSCQLKNGIIKIRLSKLPDNKKDLTENNYEVSFCESDALKKCKTLSVPLSPLAPDVYSAYSIPSKKKSHSSSKNKHAVKKKKGPEILPETEVTSSMNSTQCFNLDINEKPETDDKLNVDVLSTVRTENLEASKNDKEPFNESIDTNFTNKCNISQPENTDNVITEKLASVEEEQIVVTNEGNEIHLQTSISQSETINSKILCSINLSLINRLPEKSDTSNFLNDQISNSCSIEDKEEYLKDSSIQENSSIDGAFCSSKKISSDIKKEMLTPPDCDLTRIEHHESEIIHSPTGVQDNNKDDSCPNLTPAYSFEINTEDTCKNSCENLSAIQESALCSSANNLLFDHQDDHSTKVDTSVLLNNSHANKVKIEVPDAILANHERWNEYKEYKWCRDFTDAVYDNGNLLFKEKIAYNVGNHGLWQDPELKKQYSSEYYLNEAKKLKHQADKEIDRMVQAMKYLEAVLYFILTGNAMEHSYIDTDRVHTMYKETLALIRFISSKFQKLHNASCRNIDNKLTVLSLRCQSLLYLKMYQLRRDEVRYLHRNITSFLKSENGAYPEQVSPPHLQVSRQNMQPSQVSPSHQASPCSLTPSPAGSVASVSSQSSGYSSSELGWNSTNASNHIRAQTQIDIYSDAVTVSRNKYKMLQQQSAYLANLHLCHDLWEHADYLSSKEHSREFFLELDEECGCLSLHSPFSALVHYVRKGLYKLKDGT
ncbi:AF4/FMR2 family member 3-like [Argiope bruennichi]|uniref:AF4/FMR2 family member 3-like n=1 Tax=Argiope bruennichi TaxID=94029 RepID=UPI002494FA7F|nr:AF4/FMR2 family member 3-like [Argiope bruennichi]XP_055929149.1 AF4/FMR2 family member 3-like [Argiope bruennichi]XP_055929150.1 AF4/FMR2 family member 3-like [Argiope bruennichi]